MHGVVVGRGVALLGVAFALALVVGLLALASGRGEAQATQGPRAEGGGKPVSVEVFAPEKGDAAGRNASGFLVDLAAEFPTGVAATGAKEQVTGPGAHQNAPPFPGAFAPGKDESFPGLIVLLSTTGIGAGPGQNLAGLFNLTGFTDRKNETEVWTTWIAGAPLFGEGKSTAYVAVAADKDGNGVFDDAPNAVPDADGDGDVDRRDLKAFGVASNIGEVPFSINPTP
jgi:hypothetical protein